MKVCVIALGCEKNIINSEQMLYILDNKGFETCDDPADADVTVVNTCGFIEAARAEAIEQILEIAEYPGKIIVAGCMAERHKNEILGEMPEVSGLVGAGRFDDIAEAVREVSEGKTPLYFGGLDAPVSETPRVVTSPDYTAFLKIADGCNNHCAYCAIPSIRGSYRSRPLENIIEEAHSLCASGAKELILIAQDTTRYGEDLYGERRLPELLEKLCEIEPLQWLRIQYLYPEAISGRLIEVIAAQPKIVKYLDIPMQHGADTILSAMNRRYNGKDLRKLVYTLREKIPGVVLRTSIIAGFPGEREEEHKALCDFLEETQIPRAGVFCYSQEEGTPAAVMDGQIDEDTKRRRAGEIETLQETVMDRFNSERMGKITEVLCEGYDRYAGIYFGRSYAELPEVDGKVFFHSGRQVEPGEFVNVRITEPFEGDVMGEIAING